MSSSTQWISSSLKESFGVEPTILHSGKIEEASHGFMSTIQRIQLEWPNGSINRPKSVVVKIPGLETMEKAMEDTMDSMDESIRDKMKEYGNDHMVKISQMMHNTEADIYGLFRNVVAPFKMPLSYGTSRIGESYPCIIMEDIIGTTVTDLIDGFNQTQLYCIVDEIVDLHVYSYTNNDWKGIKFDKDFDMMEGCSYMLGSFISNITHKYPKSKSDFDILHKHLISNTEWYSTYEKSFYTNELAVLVHGDMWSPQFLWKGNELISIVDWQLSHPGSLTEDLQHLLALCVTSEERKRLTQQLLKYYYDQLEKKMKLLNRSIPFTFEYLEKDYISTLPLTTFMSLFALSLWSNSPVLRSGSDQDEERIHKMELRVLSIVRDCIEANEWS